jgi:chloramphenicol 3-O phosphotransferase
MALYDSIAAHSKVGVNVVVDVGHHNAEILVECARRLNGLPVLFVGVRCPIEVVMERRQASPASPYAMGSPKNPIPAPVRRWQHDVHVPGVYDLEVDTSLLNPEQCADAIRRWLEDDVAPTAFRRLARGDFT